MRDQRQSREYFDKSIAFKLETIPRNFARLKQLDAPAARAGAIERLCMKCLQLCIMQYSRGDGMEDIRPNLWKWVEARETQEQVLASLPEIDRQPDSMWMRLQLDSVYDALTMLAFARALHLAHDEMQRLIAAVGRRGQDALIDLAAQALGDTTRTASKVCAFPRVYGPLLEVWSAPESERVERLATFVNRWKAAMDPVYWSNSIKGGEGAYFGYWCFDVALTAILLQVPDAAFRSNEFYPVDLVDAARAG